MQNNLIVCSEAIFKKCSKCKNILSVTKYNKNNSRCDGYKEYCRRCQKSNYKIDYQKRKNIILIKNKKYNLQNKEILKKYHKQWYIKNKNRVINNSNIYKNNRLKTDTIYKLIRYSRNRINSALHSKTPHRTIDLIGCTPKEFKQHIESLFKPEMNWNNIGRKSGCWQIDHRIPLTFFNLEDVTEQKQAFHYTNCQPLWFEENMQKRDKILLEYSFFLTPKF